MAVNKVPYLEHLKQFGQRESLLIGQVAQTAADAIEEQAEQLSALFDKLDNLPGLEGEISKSVDITLTVSNWANNRQVIAIEGLTATQNGVVGLSQDVSTAEREAVASAELYVCGQDDGSFTIAYGGDKPTCDIPITVILLK
ncbi:MAG: hypothetical protein NC548_44070 [Lachnospiraceae bacterium]|nr:hypothetical protein [Lachnospiraceae bacterium]